MFLAASIALAWWWGWPAVQSLEAALSPLGPSRICHCDFTVVLDHCDRFPWRVSPVCPGHATRAASHVGNGRARGISRLLPLTLGAGVLSLVGSDSRGSLGCLDAAEDEPRLWFLAGMGDRSLVLPGVFADPVAPLLSASLSRCALAGRLDDGNHRWRGSNLETVATGSAGARLAGRNWHHGDRRLAGCRSHYTSAAAAASGPSGGRAGRGNIDGYALAASRIDKEGRYRPGRDLGGLHAGRGRVADPRGRAVPHFEEDR